MFVLQMRKRTQVEQRATLCVREAGAEVSLLGSSPSPRVLVTWCREVSGDSCRVTGSMGQPPAKMSWRHCWGWGKGYGAWASLPIPRLPLSNHLSHRSAHNPADPSSPGVLEPRKVAQPGGPAPSGLFAWCPPGSETLDKWRGRGGEQHYEEGTRISWAPTMCRVFSQEPAVAYGSGTIITYFIEEKTEAQRHRGVSCLAQGHSASDMKA